MHITLFIFTNLFNKIFKNYYLDSGELRFELWLRETFKFKYPIMFVQQDYDLYRIYTYGEKSIDDPYK